MRYRCTNCGNKCTISVQKHHKPRLCVLEEDRTAVWLPEGEAPVRDERIAHIRRCMNQDAKGNPIIRIDPHDRMNDKIYRCIADASRENCINPGGISRAVKSRGRLKAGEFYWDRVPMSKEQGHIKAAAKTSVEEYRSALKQYNPIRYAEVFGGDE